MKASELIAALEEGKSIRPFVGITQDQPKSYMTLKSETPGRVDIPITVWDRDDLIISIIVNPTAWEIVD